MSRHVRHVSTKLEAKLELTSILGSKLFDSGCGIYADELDLSSHTVLYEKAKLQGGGVEGVCARCVCGPIMCTSSMLPHSFFKEFIVKQNLQVLISRKSA